MINIKNIGILLLTLAIAGVVIYAKPEQPIGAELVLLEAQKLDTINTFQAQELAKGHYKHVPRTYTKNDDYQVDEYELPSGEVGYTVTQWKTEGKKTYSKKIDYGSLNRGFDWKVINDTTASTTSMNPFMDLLYAFTPKIFAFADNTHSTVLDRASPQWWSVADDAGLSFTGDFTLSAWVNPTTQPGGGQQVFILDKTESGGNNGYNLAYHDTLDIRTQVADSGGTSAVDFAISLTNGTWYHLVFRFTSSSKEHALWVDGSKNTGTGTKNPTNGASDFRIGTGTSETSAQGWDGKIDDARIWSRALSDGEISALFNTPCTADNGSNLEGFWVFDNDGTDDSGNNRNLTNNNSATFSVDVPYDCAVPAPPITPQSVFWFD